MGIGNRFIPRLCWFDFELCFGFLERFVKESASPANHYYNDPRNHEGSIFGQICQPAFLERNGGNRHSPDNENDGTKEPCTVQSREANNGNRLFTASFG